MEVADDPASDVFSLLTMAKRSSENYKSMVVDLTETTAIDSTSLGMLVKISIKFKEPFGSTPK